MKKYFNYEGGNILDKVKEALEIEIVATLGITYYTVINNIKYEIIDYGIVKENTNLIFVELVEVK